MSCTTEINGCPQTVSDQCVRYTGNNIPALGIVTGDSLLTVEEKISQYLTPLLTGIGDQITLTSGDVCSLITQYLTAGLVHTSKDWIKALAKGECNLQGQITSINGVIATLNADYTIGCLTGVTASSDTHDIVQAIITKLCSTATSLTALTTDVNTNYVKLSELNTLIAAYLATIAPVITQQYQKMVPFTAVEYYGPLSNFELTGPTAGKGLANLGWDKIYLCNGLNGTPDKRGRVPIGAIQGVPGGTLDNAVNPTIAGNPNYGIGDGGGANTVTLTVQQMPSHTHTASTTSVSDPHSHSLPNTYGEGGNAGHIASGGTGIEAPMIDPTGPATVNITSSTTVQNAGGGQSHPNIQPVRACYFIMYIPS